MFFAGPVCAQIAADAGADVIKVESIQRIDGWRGSGSSNANTELPGWESSPYFNWVNRNKRDITLNLTDPRGIEILKTLVREADILIENYTPRVMAKFGLSYDTLRAINPRLVMISLSGFGADSPWRDYVAFGMSTEQMAGFTHLTGYPGDEPLFTGTTGGDLFAGVMGANALFAALHHRDLTGEGQHVDFGQVEACSLYVGDAMTAWSLAGVDPGRVGNGHHHYPMQGVFACRDDQWVAITCKTSAHCAALADLVGEPAIASGAGDTIAGTSRGPGFPPMDSDLACSTASRVGGASQVRSPWKSSGLHATPSRSTRSPWLTDQAASRQAPAADPFANAPCRTT